MRIWFATTFLPFAEASGGEVVSAAVIRGLRALGHAVTVTGFLRPGTAPPGDPGIRPAGVRVPETKTAGTRAFLWMAAALATGRPYSEAKHVSRHYRRIAAEVLQGGVDLVIIDHTQMGWLLAMLPPGMPVRVLMHNAESALYRRGGIGGRLPARLLYRREAGLLAGLERRLSERAAIWVLSAADATEIGASASVLPVMPDFPAPSSAGPAFDVGLIGTWTWRPNAEALRWFVAAVLPLLPAGTTVHVAGRGADWLAGRSPGVVREGFVGDAGAFLRSARVVAIPTGYGGGIETKMLAAIASGCRVVGTPASVRGLGAPPGSVTVAAGAVAFAAVVSDAIAAARRGEPVPDAAAWSAARRKAFLAALAAGLA
jgi:hypothetical protein